MACAPALGGSWAELPEVFWTRLSGFLDLRSLAAFSDVCVKFKTCAVQSARKYVHNCTTSNHDDFTRIPRAMALRDYHLTKKMMDGIPHLKYVGALKFDVLSYAGARDRLRTRGKKDTYELSLAKQRVRSATTRLKHMDRTDPLGVMRKNETLLRARQKLKLLTN